MCGGEIRRERASTDHSYKRLSSEGGREGDKEEQPKEFRIRDIRAFLDVGQNIPVEREKLAVPERKVIFTNRKPLGKGRNT